MVYSLSYRRPSRVDSSSCTMTGEEKARSLHDSTHSGISGVSQGIPEALSFDRIISGGTCPPCTTRDFMNYLKYIEHAAENLQFFLWYRDYSNRFAQLPSKQLTLAPEWTIAQAEAEAMAAQTQPTRSKKLSPEAAAVFRDTDFSPERNSNNRDYNGNPFNTPPRTPIREAEPWTPSDVRTLDSSGGTSCGKASHTQMVAGAYEKAGLKWQPFTIQPFREESNRIIATYIADGSPRQLNLSSRERAALLHALENTTHPSAFRTVAGTVEWTLRHQAHPNFIRWTICNGNRPRVIFARGLGVGTILLGMIAAILVTLSGAGRGWRVLPTIGWVVGIATLIAAWKGMCVVLHGMHHRHLRPWELFEDDNRTTDCELKNGSFETIGSINSYENEPWVVKYEQRNIIRKIFDREIWIQEPALRQIQDTIFLQAVVGAVILSAILTAIFVAVPKGGFY